jgi:outer membrane protein OmpA-like peptidoglycan-associated protein
MPSVPDWVDPTTWFGDDQGGDSGQTPDLASVPDKPNATPTDEQQNVAESLAADRANAKYSGDALRGGTEAAAAPPPAVAATPTTDDVAEAAKPSNTNKPAHVSAPAPTQVASVDRSVAQEPMGRAMPGTLPATPSGVASAAPPVEPVQTAVLPEPAPAPAAVATTTAPRKQHRQTVAALPSSEVTAPAMSSRPAVAPTPSVTQMASVSPSDAELGFKPSAAPPLDPSVSQFVSAPIIDRYRQTAAAAGMAYSAPSAPTTVASNDAVPRRTHRPSRMVAEGGPEHMTGAVVANLDVLSPTSTKASSAMRPAAYANAQGLPASAVVFFPGDGVRLNAEARAQVRTIVEQYQAKGGQGFIRIVGHSSSRTANMSPEQHMEIIFRKSQDRANAVAQEIIREGVPAKSVLVEAVGDSQPVYYESMPKGEDGNRRAEIFLQS